MPHKLWTGVMSLTMVAVVTPLWAQGPFDRSGVSVTATGEVKAKPNAVEIDVIVGNTEARAADALAKYGEAKQRLVDACGKLKLAELSIEEREIEVTAESIGMQNGIQAFAAPNGFSVAPVAPGGVLVPNGTAVRIARKARITLRGIRDKPEADVLATIARIIDAVREAGAIVGPPPRALGAPVFSSEDGSQNSICSFILEDASDMQKRAVEAAIAQAEQEAVSLTGGRVGPMTAISPSNSPLSPWPIFVSSSNAADPKLRPSSSKFMEIPVRVTVHATFRIE